MEGTHIENHVRKGYPTLWDFLETTLWIGADGSNAIALPHRVVSLGHPDRSRRLIDELERISRDESVSPKALSILFNKETDHPYRVMLPANAKDFCRSLSESLSFILSLKAA